MSITEQMIGTGPRGGFRVPGLRIENIRNAADGFRNFLNIGDEPQKVNLGSFLDMLSVKYSVNYDVLESHEMPNPGIEACWEPESMTMYIRSDVFSNVCNDSPRSRFTVIHELGHGLLAHRRTINRTNEKRKVEIYEDSEWQADQFAAEFLMPLESIHKFKLKTASQIENQFNVSTPAAIRRVNQLMKRGELPC